MAEIGRIAFREQDGVWNAFYAMPNSMEDAIFLGSLAMPLVNDPKKKKMFMDLMRDAVGDIVQDQTGTRPTWKEPQSAQIVDTPVEWSDKQRCDLSLSLQKLSKWIETKLKQITGTYMGFSLIIWGKFYGDSMIQYVSNANREDCIKYMEDLLEGWKQGMPNIPFHERQ